jgi:hypothetical protein
MSAECSRAAEANRESVSSGAQPAFARSELTSVKTAPSALASPEDRGGAGFDGGRLGTGGLVGEAVTGSLGGGGSTAGAAASRPVSTGVPVGATGTDPVPRPAVEAVGRVGRAGLPKAATPTAEATPTARMATDATIAGRTGRRHREAGCRRGLVAGCGSKSDNDGGFGVGADNA